MLQKKLNPVTKDGKTINAILFYPADKPKGILIVCHGFGEHIKRYEEFAQYLTDSRYACIVYDQRGHGEMGGIAPSKRKKQFGIIPDYKSFLDDIDIIKNKALSLYPDIPLILYGHSMGGNIAINYLLTRKQNRFTCAVLETPWLRLFDPVPAPLVALAKILGKLNHKWAIIKKLKLNHISRDKKRNGEIGSDELYHNRISFRMFSGINDAGENALKKAADISIPVLLICAKDDKIVSPKAIEEFSEKSKDNVKLKSYNKAYHSVHNDIIKDVYYKDLIEYLDSFIQA
ncbi:MAG: alpha/beta hydrolase [Lacrimispora sp.]|uniref:alpha/beta hydrolase n=1 Tax=Lacrimispora sp. TaxID=2719234 RepID=UPI0039E55385